MKSHEPNNSGYIGASLPRANAKRLLQGRGSFIDDLRFPRLANVVFLRSPHAHAMIKSLDFSKARTAPGVIAVVDGRAVAEYCTPWVGVLSHLKGLKSAPQHPIAIDRACSQGEAVAAVVAVVGTPRTPGERVKLMAGGSPMTSVATTRREVLLVPCTTPTEAWVVIV